MTRRPASVGYETRDVAPRAVVVAGIGLLLGTAFCGLLAAGVLALFSGSEQPPVQALNAVAQEPPAPRLEIDGRMNRAAVEAAAQSKLTGYDWVDRSAGTVRIPIARAMELLAAQGWGKP